MNFALAMMQQLDLGPAKKEIAALPLEERCLSLKRRPKEMRLLRTSRERNGPREVCPI